MECGKVRVRVPDRRFLVRRQKRRSTCGVLVDLNDHRRRIDVQLSEVTIAVEADLASLSFLQRYQSDNLEVVSVKLIEMEKTDGRWLIRQETEQ